MIRLRHQISSFLIAFIVPTLTGCGGKRDMEPGLPPIPLRAGPLQIDVVYPPFGARIAARDSNFMFGSVGNGRAGLSINGIPVPVRANGSFLAYQPVPSSPGDTVAVYEIRAWLAQDTLERTHTVRLSGPGRRVPPGPGGVAIEESSLSPGGTWWVREAEAVPVRLRASPGAAVRLILPDGSAAALAEIGEAAPESAGRWRFGRIPSRAGRLDGTGVYAGRFNATVPLGRGSRTARPPRSWSGAGGLGVGCRTGEGRAGGPERSEGGMEEPDSARTSGARGGRSRMGTGDGSGACAIVEAIIGGDTTRTRLPLDLWILEMPGPVVELQETPSAVGEDGVVVGRPAPGATYAWLWANGIRARVTGRRNEALRIALDSRTEAWVAFDDVRWPMTVERAAEVTRVGTVRIVGEPDRLRVRVAVEEPVPYQVRVDGQRLSLTLYGAYSDTDWLRYGPADPFLERAAWEQPTRERYVLHLDLAARPWGYRVRHGDGWFELAIRKPPPIDPELPLAGRTIVVDPGHPPAGATGPTRLYEGDANLAIAYRVQDLLEAEGARVILVRRDRGTVRLYDRPRLAEELGAELLVSIHNNALPDGVNPYENHGTSVYYFHDHEVDLARSLQQALLEAMGLRDLGIGRGNLALARPMWFPSALTEGAFMMIPEQEAALRTPKFQEAYARGVVEGIRRFLRDRSAR